ncbi:MAG TPA: hypothetical protein VNK03_02450 [Gammaproteobacteria bacterium]|nr:hypothetical protein [Gammaproteobacteria bacterium]
MQHEHNRISQEDLFQDELCKQLIEKITHLGELIQIEEAKLFKAMQNAKSPLSSFE